MMNTLSLLHRIMYYSPPPKKNIKKFNTFFMILNII
jgi:hypothetical protein